MTFDLNEKRVVRKRPLRRKKPAMFTNVTLPVDPTIADVEALSIASALAGRMGIGLELVSVLSSDTAKPAATIDTRMIVPGVVVTRRTLPGHRIDDALARAVHDHPGALWCVSTHAKWALTEAFTGSLSEELVRASGAAIVLIGPHAERIVVDGSVLLVVVDDRADSEAILPSAMALAKALHIGVRLVEVLHMSHVPAGHVAEEANLVRHLAEAWSTAEVSVDFEVLHGEHSSDAVLAYVAREPEIALVAMATKGLPAPARMIYPSETYRVVRKSPCAVLVMHPLPAVSKSERRNVVVAGMSNVESSAKVIQVAVMEARARGAQLLLVHTWEEPAYRGVEFGMAYSGELSQDFEDAQLHIIDEAVAAARLAAPDVEVLGVVARGRTADVLVSYGESADLIVVGRHDHNALTEALLGSVSRSVGRRAPCPVMVVPSSDPT